MLTELQIKNVAIIDKVTIEFGNGFNVLTGETGAGKSILIDSINMALGGRTSRDLVRTGTEYAFSQAVFEVSPNIEKKLSEMDIDIEDGCVILSRKITAEGKSVCKINGMTTPLSQVREVGEILLSIHGQQDNHSLLKTSSHREFVDNYAENDELMRDYKIKYDEYLSLKKQYEELLSMGSERERRLDILKYSVDEIDKACLKEGEEEELEARRSFLENAEDIMSNLSKAYAALYGDETMQSTYDLTETAAVCLENASEYDESLKKYSDTISSVLADINDVTRDIKSYIDNIDYEVGELDMVMERLSLITNLKRKYMCSDIKEVLEYANKCKTEIDEIENLDENLTELKEKIAAKKDAMILSADMLTKSRIRSGEKLSKAIMNELGELDMSRIVFKVNIEKCDYNSFGSDNVEFLISTNPGEDLKSLSKIASGGEMSRIMLAIKSVLSKDDIVETMIFDEIDTGVSGRAAQKISEKICKISRSKQVLCITHLPQLASMADRQYLIEKTSDKSSTRTNVRMLDLDERKTELSRIIGGVSVTDTTIKAAEDMLNQAETLKKSFIDNV